MLLRRKFATAVGVAALAVPLASCGFDYATDQSYNPAVGINEREDDIDILNTVVVTGQSGSGTLVAALANNSNDEADADALVGIAPAEGTDVTVTEIEPIQLGPEGFVQLGEEDIHLTGTVEPGDVLPLTFSFESGLEIETGAAVVTNCDEFEGYDTSAGGGSSEPSEEPMGSADHEESGESEESHGTVEPGEGNASVLPGETPDSDPYSCEYAQQGGGH